MTQPELTEAAREYLDRFNEFESTERDYIATDMANFAQAEIDKAIASFVREVFAHDLYPDFHTTAIREVAKERGVEIS